MFEFFELCCTIENIESHKREKTIGTSALKRWFGLDSSGSFLRSPSRTYPLLCLGVYLLLFSYYYIIRVPQNEAELIDRGFRVLALTAEQVRSVVQNFAIIFETQADNLAKGIRTDRYPSATAFSDDLEMQICQTAQLTPGVVEMTLVSRQNKSELEIRYQSNQGNSGPNPAHSACGRAYFQNKIEAFLNRVPEDVFDDLALTDGRGRVLYQKGESAVRLTDVSSLIEESTLSHTPAQSPTSELSQAVDKALGHHAPPAATFSKLIDVTIAGVKYKLLLQPIAFTATEMVDGRRNPEFRLLLCGLMMNDHLNTKSKSMPSRWLVYIFSGVTILLIAAWPILKLKTMAPTEGFRPRELLWFALSILLATRLLTILVLYATQVESGAVQPFLATLGDHVERNLQIELDQAFSVLHSLTASQELQAAARNLMNKNKTKPVVLDPHQVDLLVSGQRALIAHHGYPYFDQVFWTWAEQPEEGYQAVKWTVQNRLTGQTAGRGYPWFDAFNAGRFWSFRNDVWQKSHLKELDGRPQFILDSVYSPNTGQHLSILAQPVTNPSIKNLKAAVMVTSLVSIVNPVLPPGFGFALIEPDGTVRYHSDSSLNQRQNFFREFDHDDQLKAAVLSGAAQFVEGNYEGRDSFVRIRPLRLFENSNLFIVTFLDASSRNHFYIDIFLLTTISALAFGGWNAAFALLASWRLWKQNIRWYWPEGAKLRAMNLLFWIYLILIVGMEWVYFKASPRWTSPLLTSLPIVVLGITFAALFGHYYKGDKWLQIRKRVVDVLPAVLRESLLDLPFPDVVSAYVADTFLLVLLLALIPTATIFKQSFQCERLFYGANHLLGLESRLHERNERIRTEYSKVKTSTLENSFVDQAFIDRRLRLSLDRYDLIWREVTPVLDSSSQPSSQLATLVDDRIITAILPSTLRVPHPLSPSEQMSVSCKWLWMVPEPNRLLIQSSVDDRNLDQQCKPIDGNLSSNLATGRLMQSADQDVENANLVDLPIYRVPNLVACSLLLLLGVGLFFVVRYTATHRLVVKFPAKERWPPFEAEAGKQPTDNLLLIGLPRAGKTESLKKLENCSFVNIRKRAEENDWGLPAIEAPEAPSEALEAPQKAPEARSIVVVDEFEYGINDHAINEKKLELIEGLVNREDLRVIIVSTIDPMFFLFEEYFDPGSPVSPTKDVYHAAVVLSSFQKRVLPGSPRVKNNEFYQLLGATCSLREQLALSQLADDGAVNRKNWFALKHLYDRRLVDEVNPNAGIYRIVDPGFEEYVRNGLPKKLIENLRASDRELAWSGAKRVIFLTIIATILFLLTAWQDVLKAGFGQFAGLLAAASSIMAFLPGTLLPGLARAFRFRGSDSGGE